MNIRVKSGKFDELKNETVVVFCTTKAKGKETEVQVSAANKEISELVARVSSDKVYSGKKGEMLFLREFGRGARNLLLVGLGDVKAMSADGSRRLAAQVFKNLKGHRVESYVLWMDSFGLGAKQLESFGQAMCEGTVMAAFKFNEFKSTGKNEEKKIPEPVEASFVFGKSQLAKSFEKGVQVGQIVADATNFARRMGDMPANVLTPTQMGEEAKSAAKGTKIKVTVWNKEKIQKERMEMFLNVAKGSHEPPVFIVMEYKGAAASEKPIVFVGKGLTFDSGGISIKPSQAMDEMKYDMCGGAAVIAAVQAIAKLKVKANVIGLVPATENMPGANPNKPGDISVARNGKTVEVLNTDAEGRLILGDALSYACDLDPAVILDVATLTGAIKMALGETHTGYFCRHDKLVKKVEAAAESSGEWIWRLPLVDEHVSDMKGNYADLANISTGSPSAGSAKGAAFLSEFVNRDIPWAHFDIAATAWNVASRLPYCTGKGASGVMVRTFVDFARQWKSK